MGQAEGWSEHEDASRCRIATGPDRPQQLAIPKRQVGERGRRGSQGSAVSPRVGDEEDQVIDAAVPPLEGELALERLDVMDRGLGFHRDAPAASADHGIPGSEVAGVREGHLGRPTKVGMDTCTQPLKQTRVSNVPEWIARGIRSQHKVQPENLADGRQIVELQVNLAALEPPQPRVVDNCGDRHLTQAEPGADPGATDFLGKPIHAGTRQAPTPIGGPLAGSHVGASWRALLHLRLAARLAILEAARLRCAPDNNGRGTAQGWPGFGLIPVVCCSRRHSGRPTTFFWKFRGGSAVRCCVGDNAVDVAGSGEPCRA